MPSKRKSTQTPEPDAHAEALIEALRDELLQRTGPLRHQAIALTPDF
jgi:hypothetical protein